MHLRLIWISRVLVLAIGAMSIMSRASENTSAQFLVRPYLQNPSHSSVSVIWFSSESTPGLLEVNDGTELSSNPESCEALAWHEAEKASGSEGAFSGSMYRHRVRLNGLEPGREIPYSVTQGEETIGGVIRLAAVDARSVRFMVYADSETEPESTGKIADWAEPGGDSERKYLVDQSTGYRENLKFIESRDPHFVAIAGDLVESGGEQRDWNEFWLHHAGEYGSSASRIPIMPALGNHEVFGGLGGLGGFGAHQRAVDRYLAYFEVPSNGTANDAFEGRYYRSDFGPVCFITLDSTNGLPDDSDNDTNIRIDQDADDSSPLIDFNPGSEQYAWLEKELADAKEKEQLIFVQFHHSPYSVWPHGFPVGTDAGQNDQSGHPLRVLTPLFQEYGVAAVFSGHCEMYEHSIVGGVHFFDVGIGGDGLRGPRLGEDAMDEAFESLSNEHQVFLAHLDAPEKWEGTRLVEGGKHYGHVEVNVSVGENGRWLAEIEPVYVFPLMDDEGNVTGWERRVYDDRVSLIGAVVEDVAEESGALDSGSDNDEAEVDDVAEDTEEKVDNPGKDVEEGESSSVVYLVVGGSVLVALVGIGFFLMRK